MYQEVYKAIHALIITRYIVTDNENLHSSETFVPVGMTSYYKTHITLSDDPLESPVQWNITGMYHNNQ